MSAIIIDVRVNGYKGDPKRIIAVCKTSNGVLYISKERQYQTGYEKPVTPEDIALAKNTLIVTDAPRSVQKWNLAFDEKVHLGEAVQAYHEKSKNNLLHMDDSVRGRFDIMDSLQVRKLEMAGGQVWELHSDIDNGKMCTLLACWAAVRGMASHTVIAQMDDDVDFSDDDDDGMTMPFSL